MTTIHVPAALAEVVVTLGETILDVRHVGPAAGRAAVWSPWLPRFTVGEGPGAHLPMQLGGQDGAGLVALVESVGAGIRVRSTDGMAGTVTRGGSTVVLQPGDSVLQAGDAADLAIGAVRVKIRVEACTPVDKFRAAIDRPLWIGQGGALMLFAALMIVAQRTPADVAAPRFDDPEVQARLIRYLTPAEPVLEAVRAVRPTAVAHTQPRAVATPVVEAPTSEVPAIERIARGVRGEGVAELARQSGIFGLAGFMKALEEAAGEAEASRLRYVAAAGDDAAFVAAAARAAPTVLTGLGLAGTGRGGGGLAAGAIDFDWAWLVPKDGLRSMNAKRLQARAGKERFAAREVSAQLPERRQSVAWTGSVGRDLIRGVVNRNKPDVRRCFRDGMASNPDLNGEIEMAFTISSDGAVAYASVARSTLADAAVEACVTETIKRWKFPVFVASGGDVDVRFPFAVGKA